MADAALPAHSGDNELEIGILPGNSTVDLVQRHGAFSSLGMLRERFMNKNYI